jgi:hypothetical protein
MTPKTLPSHTLVHEYSAEQLCLTNNAILGTEWPDTLLTQVNTTNMMGSILVMLVTNHKIQQLFCTY